MSNDQTLRYPQDTITDDQALHYAELGLLIVEPWDLAALIRTAANSARDEAAANLEAQHDEDTNEAYDNGRERGREDGEVEHFNAGYDKGFRDGEGNEINRRMATN